MTSRDSPTDRLTGSSVMVLLTCGCKGRMRDVPYYTAKLSCQSGLGHGYSLGWVEAVQRDGLVLENNRVKNGEQS